MQGKLMISLAVLALVSNFSAQGLRVRSMGDNLFTDDEDQAETLASIKSAEQIHNAKFSGISDDQVNSVIKEKSVMLFQGDDFMKNDIRKLGKSNLVQIDAEIKYPEPRPIYELLSVVSDDIKIENGIEFRSAEHDSKLLAGAQLNDEDDNNETFESLASAERISGNKMTAPEYGAQLFQKQGNFAHNFLADDDRVYTKELSDALLDKEDELKLAQEHARIEREKILAQKKQQEKVVQKAEEDINIHFEADDLEDLQLRYIDKPAVFDSSDVQIQFIDDQKAYDSSEVQLRYIDDSQEIEDAQDDSKVQLRFVDDEEELKKDNATGIAF